MHELRKTAGSSMTKLFSLVSCNVARLFSSYAEDNCIICPFESMLLELESGNGRTLLILKLGFDRGVWALGDFSGDILLFPRIREVLGSFSRGSGSDGWTLEDRIPPILMVVFLFKLGLRVRLLRNLSSFFDCVLRLADFGLQSLFSVQSLVFDSLLS